MTTTSGTFNFGSPLSEQLITDAFERIGILPDLLTSQNINSAQRSINLILSEWINRGLNLWTVKQGMLSLSPNQYAYALPTGTSDVLEANIRTVNRQLGGTPFSSAGGIAQNAFDGNAATACTQTSSNGYISYNYGNGAQKVITVVGVQSNATLNYTLLFETSTDNASWTTVATIPEQSYPVGVNIWFSVPLSTAAQYFRVRETGGATLNVQELYFDTVSSDIPISRISRSEWITYPNKAQTGQPSSFYVDRQINPILNLWLTPTAQYNILFYTRIQMIQDIGALTNMADIPQRFLEALCSELATKLAIKYKPERIDILRREADSSFDKAAREDSERVPLRIYGDYSGGWTYQ